MIRMRGTLLLVAIAVPAAAISLAAQAPVGASAPDFTLRDQYDSALTLGSLRGRVVLVVAGDRHGNQYIGAYTQAVRERFGRDRVRLVPIANLRGVPFFMKGYVRGRFRGTNPDSTPKSSVLLDWGGVLARLYGFREALTNVYLIDRAGVLRYTAAGRGTNPETRALTEALEAVVTPGGS